MTMMKENNSQSPTMLLFVLAVALYSITSPVTAFSASTGGSTAPNTAQKSLFETFQFAPNGVCLNPRYFYEINTVKNDDLSQRQLLRPSHFTMRNVPGDGDCMFLAVSLAAATSMGLGGNDALLRAIVKETRNVVAEVMESNGNLYIGKDRQVVAAKQLLHSATRQEGFRSTKEYLQRLRTEGTKGGLYGGGPELTVLANVLRRPISIYELDPTTQSEAKIMDQSQCPIVCKGTFGDGLFEDPIDEIPDSALQSTTLPPGAYSWHLHILVLNTSPIEKHACVLLPAQAPPPGTDPTLRP